MALGMGSGLWNQYMRDVGWDKVPRRSILDSSKLRHPAHRGEERFLCSTPRCLVSLSLCCLGTWPPSLDQSQVVCTPRPDGFMATRARRITTDMTHIPRVCEPAQWSESHATVLVKWRHHY
jgi:hypothetical protein